MLLRFGALFYICYRPHKRIAVLQRCHAQAQHAPRLLSLAKFTGAFGLSAPLPPQRISNNR
jgi:hypothetical protein